MDLTSIISNRRTHKLFDGRPVTKELLEKMIRTASFAPNHRRTEPWRYTIVRQEQISKFWQELKPHFAEVFQGNDADFIAKKQESLEQRLLNIGAMVYMTSLRDEKALIEEENYAACCAAAQNLMLLATENNLGSFWCTGKVFASEACAKILGRKASKEKFVGAFWLGYPTKELPLPNYDIDSKINYWE